jgi:murein DD-endopeptidase MepM/ murein hydrolase activator NlpD
MGAPPDAPCVRRSLALAVATTAAAVVTTPAFGQTTGGAEFLPFKATVFTLSPAAIAPGAPLTIHYRIAGRRRARVQVRVDLLPAAGGRPVATLRLGRRRTNRLFTGTWRPQLQPGRYTARLRATTRQRGRAAHASSRSAVEIVAPVAATAGVFPVQGAYSLGGAEARFGASREGHTHQGQDILAAAGTPVVAPRTGFVSWRAYQAAGAGHYVVLHGDDSRDYVFMHLLDGSVAVQKGQAVPAGGRIGAVGATGHATGPHLHFEIWPNGWYADGSQPIDPLPDLLAWAAG